jgi:hypothetical protein
MYQKRVIKRPRFRSRDEFVRRGIARGHGYVARHRTLGVRRRQTVARVRAIRALGPRCVRDEFARDARVEQGDPARRVAFEVERLAREERVREVVGDRDVRARVRALEPVAKERRSFVDRLRGKVMDQIREELAERGRLEDHGPVAGRHVDRVAGTARFLGRDVARFGTVEQRELRAVRFGEAGRIGTVLL